MKTSAPVALVVLLPLLAVMAKESVALDLAAEREALLAVDREFARATAEQGIDGWLSFFAQDATIFPPGAPVVTGLDNIREHYAATGFDPTGLTWQPVAAELSAAGDLGYTYGTWTFQRAVATGEVRSSSGKYLSVWRKDEQGRWRLVADIGSPDPPRADGG